MITRPQRRAIAALGTLALAMVGCLAPARHHETVDVPPSLALSGRAKPVFHGSQETIPVHVEARMRRWSWRPECPVALTKLRYLRVPYVDSGANEQVGALVVHEQVADEVLTVFSELRAARFAIERMNLIEDYEGDDGRSMAANNTSAFNCREKPALPGTFSNHSYGTAIDINPKVNPYARPRPVALVPRPVDDEGRPVVVSPPSGARFLDRSISVPGMVRAGDACHQALTTRGWTWGGSWSSLVDYQHFEKPLARDQAAGQ